MTRAHIPPGEVSSIRGRWQGPGLTWVMRVVLVLGALSAPVPGDAGRALATAAVAIVIAVPLLRVAWLVLRWSQERDPRFIAAGVGLLALVGLGAALAAAGVGS